MVDGRIEGAPTEYGLRRRKFVLGVMLTSIVAAFGSLLTMLKALSPAREGGGYVATIKPGDRLVYANGDNAGAQIQAASMGVGDAALAYPAGKSSNPANLVQLVKLEKKDFQPPTRINLTDAGFVAYSAICTHLGCTVSWVKNQHSPSASYTECFCHNSIFDPERGAEVTSGPAPTPLAQIGVKVSEDGVLVFTSDFDGPIGPQA